MRVGSAGNDVVAAAHQRGGQRLRVFNDAPLVGAELLAEGFFERDGLGGDDVHQGAALNAGKEAFVDRLGVRLPAEHHAAARAAERFVGRGGDNVRVGYRIGMKIGRHQAGNVGHVDQQEGAGLVGDLAEALKIKDSGIGARTDNQELRPVGHRLRFHFVIIDAAGLAIDAVGLHAIEAAGKIDRAAVGEVAPMGQVHSQDRVAGLEQGKIGRHVGLGTGMGLYVGVLGAKEALGAIDRQLLDLVDIFAPAVVAAARIALGIFIGQQRALGFEDGPAGVVFRRDENNLPALPLQLGLDGPGDLGVNAFQFSTAGHDMCGKCVGCAPGVRADSIASTFGVSSERRR